MITRTAAENFVTALVFYPDEGSSGMLIRLMLPSPRSRGGSSVRLSDTTNYSKSLESVSNTVVRVIKVHLHCQDVFI